MVFKKRHDEVLFQQSNYLKKKIANQIHAGTYEVSRKLTPRDIFSEKRNHIINKLSHLMPKNRRKFYENLVASDAPDMLEGL